MKMKFTVLPMRIPKNIFFAREDLMSGGGTAGKFRENGRKQGNLLLSKLGSDQF